MDKKAVQILNRLMDDRKKHSVSAEELAYARKMGVVVEDRPITQDQAVDVLTRCFDAVSLEDATQAFLYSLSSRDMDYRYILASFVYARSWLSFDRGHAEEVPEKLTGSFFNWVKQKGGGICGTIGKPIFYLEQFTSMERRAASNADVEILRSILELADSISRKTHKVCYTNPCFHVSHRLPRKHPVRRHHQNRIGLVQTRDWPVSR
jgi:hypothetical protein